jgi:tetratricopeptide (TPR) repeat protein
MARKKSTRFREKKKPHHHYRGRKKAKNDHLNIRWWLNKKLLLSITAILLIVFLAFLPMLKNDFTNWDDIQYVTENDLIKSLSFDGVTEIFKSKVASNYHPITILSLAINYKISGLEPFSYFFTNLLLHLANTFLVFLFIYKLSGSKTSTAIIVSLLFGIHPMHVESVAWISERKDVLYTFFMLLGFIFYLGYIKRPDFKKYVLVFMMLLLSLLSKPAAVVFPVLLLLIDHYKERKFTTRTILEKAPFFAIALALGIATLQIQSVQAMETMYRFDVLERLLFSCYGFVMYISRMFFPWPLSTLHPFPEPGNLPLFYKITPVITLAMLGLAYYFRRYKTLVFGLLFLMVSIAPVMQFITIGNAVIAERYTYLAYIGPFFIIGNFYCYIQYQKIGFRGGKPILNAILAMITIAFIVLTFQRTKVWKNSETLWTDVIRHYPESHRAYMSRGMHYFTKNQDDLAIADFTKSLTYHPNYSPSLEYRGRIYDRLNQNELAYNDFNQLVHIEPQNDNAYLLRGRVLAKLNKVDEAFGDFNKTLELAPNNIYALNNRGTLFFNKKQDYSSALKDFNKAIDLDPRYKKAYLNRSRCYYMINNKIKALEDALKAQNLGEQVPNIPN